MCLGVQLPLQGAAGIAGGRADRPRRHRRVSVRRSEGVQRSDRLREITFCKNADIDRGRYRQTACAVDRREVGRLMTGHRVGRAAGVFPIEQVRDVHGLQTHHAIDEGLHRCRHRGVVGVRIRNTAVVCLHADQRDLERALHVRRRRVTRYQDAVRRDIDVGESLLLQIIRHGIRLRHARRIARHELGAGQRLEPALGNIGIQFRLVLQLQTDDDMHRL